MIVVCALFCSHFRMLTNMLCIAAGFTFPRSKGKGGNGKTWCIIITKETVVIPAGSIPLTLIPAEAMNS